VLSVYASSTKGTTSPATRNTSFGRDRDANRSYLVTDDRPRYQLHGQLVEDATAVKAELPVVVGGDLYVRHGALGLQMGSRAVGFSRVCTCTHSGPYIRTQINPDGGGRPQEEGRNGVRRSSVGPSVLDATHAWGDIAR
jgi:hypothetical protein